MAAPGELGLEAKQAASWKQSEAGRWLWLLHLFIHLMWDITVPQKASPPFQNTSLGTVLGLGNKGRTLLKNKNTRS